jgi:hypothetical protein
MVEYGGRSAFKVSVDIYEFPIIYLLPLKAGKGASESEHPVAVAFKGW